MAPTTLFNRRHYAALAEFIRAHEWRWADIEAFADFLSEDNPLFDRDRFLSAGGCPT